MNEKSDVGDKMCQSDPMPAVERLLHKAAGAALAGGNTGLAQQPGQCSRYKVVLLRKHVCCTASFHAPLQPAAHFQHAPILTPPPTCISVLNLVLIHVCLNAVSLAVHGQRHLACMYVQQQQHQAHSTVLKHGATPAAVFPAFPASVLYATDTVFKAFKALRPSPGSASLAATCVCLLPHFLTLCCHHSSLFIGPLPHYRTPSLLHSPSLSKSSSPNIHLAAASSVTFTLI